MKLLKYFILILSLIAVVYGQNSLHVVYLKNGEILKGIITENSPNKYIKIKLLNGQIQSSNYSDISRIATEDALPAPTDVAEKEAIIIRTDPPKNIVTAESKKLGESPVLITEVPTDELPLKYEKDGSINKIGVVSKESVEQPKITITPEIKTNNTFFYIKNKSDYFYPSPERILRKAGIIP